MPIATRAAADPENMQAMVRASCSLPSSLADAASQGFSVRRHHNALPGSASGRQRNRDQTPNFIKTNKCLILPEACLYSCTRPSLETSPSPTHSPTETLKENALSQRVRGNQIPPGILSKSDWRVSFLSRLLDPTNIRLANIPLSDTVNFKRNSGIFYFLESSTL